MRSTVAVPEWMQRQVTPAVLWACLAGVSLLWGACAASEGSSRAAHPQPHRVGDWVYEVWVSPGAERLRVEARFEGGASAWFGVDRFAHPYVGPVEVESGGRSRRVARRGRRWLLPECSERSCTLRYDYSLGEAARAIDRFGFAGFRSGVLMAPPSTWLLHPKQYDGPGQYRLRVHTQGDEQFVSGLFQRTAEEGRAARKPCASAGQYQAPARLLFEAPYSAFGRFRNHCVALPDAELSVAISAQGPPLPMSDAELLARVRSAALVVTTMYGGFPAPEVQLIVLPSPGSGLFGMQLGNGGASILLFVGTDLTDADERDWVLVHEMLHLGLPSMERRHLFLAEGLATYLGPLARAAAGSLSPELAWQELAVGLLWRAPRSSPKGLEGARSWARVYWGGALFALLWDLELRRHGSSLPHVLRGVVNAGGHTGSRWSLERLQKVADGVAGQPVLATLWERHARRPGTIDAKDLLQWLGVSLDRRGELVLSPASPWAERRRALSEAHGQSGLTLPGVPKSPL